MRTVRRAVATVTVAVLALVAVPAQVASAGPDDQKRKVDRSISELRGDLEDTSADLATAYLRLHQVQTRLPGARAELARAQHRLDAAHERALELGRQFRVAQAKEGKARDDLRATARSTRQTRDTLGGIAREAYQTGGVGDLSVALAAQSAEDFTRRVTYVDTALQLQGVALARLSVDRAQTRAQGARLTAVRQQVSLLRAQAEANVVQARQLERRALAAKVTVERLVAQEAADVRTIAARKAAERRRLDGLEVQSRLLQAQLAAIARAERARAARLKQQARQERQARLERQARQAAKQARRVHRPAPRSAPRTEHRTSARPEPRQGTSSGGSLSSPVSGAYVSSEFGMRFHPILHYWRLHAGRDYAVGCGTPVHAAADGSVISAGWAGGYGNRIVLGHGLERGVSLATTYNHLTRIVVGSGHVRRGQLIGYSGTTGSSTGCHLHFETYADGTPVDPRRWL